MAPKKKRNLAVDVWKKKRWFPIHASTSFKEALIGETPAIDPESVVGRVAQANLMMITGDMKKQGTTIYFQVEKMQEGKGQTRPIAYKLSSTMIRRFVRRGMTRIDDSIIVKSKDGKFLRIKPFILTLNRVPKSLASKIRKNAKNYIIDNISEKNSENIYSEIAFNRFQKKMYETLKKIYPLKLVEIRSVIELDAEKVKKASKKVKVEVKVEDEEVEEQVIKVPEKKEDKAEEKTVEDKSKPAEKVKEKQEKTEEHKTEEKAPTKETETKEENKDEPTKEVKEKQEKTEEPKTEKTEENTLTKETETKEEKAKSEGK